MNEKHPSRRAQRARCARVSMLWRRPALWFLALCLGIEALDELISGGVVAAWPLIIPRLGLSDVELGLAVGLPVVLGNLIEPFLMLTADTRWRRAVWRAGGVALVAATLGVALAPNFITLLIALIVFYPASGAFVGFSQLEGVERGEDAQRMLLAWNLVGLVGAIGGPLLIAASSAQATGWRWTLAGLGVVGAALLMVASRCWSILDLTAPAGPAPVDPGPAPVDPGPAPVDPGPAPVDPDPAPVDPDPAPVDPDPAPVDPGPAPVDPDRADPRRLIRPLACLGFSDLALDVFAGFIAVWIARSHLGTPALGALAVAVHCGAMLLPSAWLLRWPPRSTSRFVRTTGLATILVLGALLCVDHAWARLGGVALLGLLTGAWYPLLKTDLYSAAGDRPGRALAWHSVSAASVGVFPLLIGALAAATSLDLALGLVLLGPLSLMLLHRDARAG